MRKLFISATIATLMLGAAQQSFGQNYGYQNRPLYVGAGASAYSENAAILAPWKGMWHIRAEYIVSRTQVLGLEGTFLNYFVDDYRHYFDTPPNLDDPLENMTGTFIGFNYKKFKYSKTGSIAPVGKYVQYGIGIMSHSGTYTDQNEQQRTLAYGGGMFWAVNMAMGSQRVIMDRFVLDFQVRANLPPGLALRMMGDNAYSTEDRGARNIYRYYILGVNLTLSYLLPEF